MNIYVYIQVGVQVCMFEYIHTAFRSLFVSHREIDNKVDFDSVFRLPTVYLKSKICTS